MKRASEIKTFKWKNHLSKDHVTVTDMEMRSLI